MDINSPTYTGVRIEIYGTLSFNNGMKLNVDCNSQINISSTGQLVGGNPGSKVDVCGVAKWNGGSPLSGPVSWGTAPLPIELIEFTANATGNAVACEWTTATETNNDYFLLQRSVDLKTIEAIGKINGAGNSNTYKHNQ